MIQDDDEPKLHPIWKQAVQDFLATDPQPDDVVTMEQLKEWFEMPSLTLETIGKRDPEKAVEDYKLRFLALRHQWQHELLRKHQIQFDEKERGGGWRVLAPDEVARFTRRQSDRELKKVLARQRERLAHTDLSELSQAQQRDHAETLVRCSWKLRAIKDVDKKKIELPELPKPLPRRKGDDEVRPS